MASILKEIGTPLQLVALFLLLVAGLARLMLRSGKWKATPALTQMLVNRVFLAAILALVLGVGGPILVPILTPPDRSFRGAVFSTSGDAVAGATVHLIPFGSASTNQLGQFDFPVPSGGAMPEYRLQVSAPGYKTSDVLTRTEAQMRDLDIRLVPETAYLVKGMQSAFVVGQYYGTPVVLAGFRVENPDAGYTVISEISGRLSSADAAYSLSPAAFTILGQFGPFGLVSGPIQILPGQRIDLHVVLGTGAAIPDLLRRLGALHEYNARPPCAAGYDGSVLPLTDAAYAMVRSFAVERFAWKAGRWHLDLAITGDNRSQNFTRDFTLTEAEVERLRGSMALMQHCQTVNLEWPFAQDGTVANFLSK